jgi:hypothetical protein
VLVVQSFSSMTVSKWVRIDVQFSKSTLKAEDRQIKPRSRPEFYAASPTSRLRQSWLLLLDVAAARQGSIRVAADHPSSARAISAMF